VSETAAAIATQALSKVYGRVCAVADLTLTVERAEVFGFLGPNGAGKTTSVHLLLALAHPTTGTGTVLGKPLGDREVRERIGFLPEHFTFHEHLTAREILHFHGRLYSMKRAVLRRRIDDLLTRVNLLDAADRPVREYSKGMTQRVGLAQALLNRPDLVFLDEPTSGLDPIGRLMVRDVIAELLADGATVFLNSHLLEEVEATCQRVAFIRQGRIVQDVVLAETRRALEVELKIDRDADALGDELQQFGTDLQFRGNVMSLCVEHERVLPELVRWLTAHGIGLYSLHSRHQSLERLFLRAMDGEEGSG
jgi:ABC-2 type transport system ATP-binding protein